MKQLLIILCFLTINVSAFSQTEEKEYQHSDYDWNENPSLSTLTEEQAEMSALVLKDQRILEYGIGDEGLNLYKTIHKLIRVNNDQAVESFNKVFVPMNGVVDFKVLKARSISPDGKITLLNQDNIKELSNVGDMGNFKIFAIEGVEIGGEVEYIYTTHSTVRDPYGREFFQSETPVAHAEFKLISPSLLQFEGKGYNGFPSLEELKEEKSEADSIRVLTASLKNIEGLQEEQYSLYRSNLMKLDYKLSYNADRPENRLYGWDMASASFGRMLMEYSSDNSKPIQKELKAMKLSKIKSFDDKIATLEEYLKSTYSLEMGGTWAYSTLDQILVNKYANELGFVQLFTAFMKEADIPFQLVVTSNRFNSRFDSDFEGWNNFTDILLYFPKTDKYISPSLFQYRYGSAPYQFAENHGLFITQWEEKKDYWVYEGEVGYIEMSKAENNKNNITADVKFDEDFDVSMDIRHGWTGYRADEFRTAYNFQKMDFIKGRVTSGMEGAEIKDVKLNNESMLNASNKENEFYAESELEVSSLIEKAGNSYLFKIGEIIGGQVELYQENKRQHSIDMPHPTYYKRIINFTIPDGYKMQGIDDVKIDKFIEIDGQKVNRFVSDYSIDGKNVTVTSDEFYKLITLPKELYEDFRGVINAAADFNKVVLVFEKE